MSSGFVATSVADGIARIRFDRPTKKNALTAAMYADAADALRAADADPATRVILFSGAGDAFTGGNDLADFMADPPRDEDAPVFRFLRALAVAETVLMAAAHGVAVGIGTTMLLHCDLVLAAEGTRFALPFVNLGLVPEAASSLLLPRQAGYHRAAEMLLLGEPFDAATALAAGLVNRVVSADALDDEADALARAVASRPAEALRLTKRLLRTPEEPVADRIRREGAVFAERLRSPEMAAAVAAFFDRRRTGG